MTDQFTRPKTLEGFKSHAKRLKRESGISHTDALEKKAREFGFKNYRAARDHYSGEGR